MYTWKEREREEEEEEVEEAVDEEDEGVLKEQCGGLNFAEVSSRCSSTIVEHVPPALLFFFSFLTQG